MPKGKTKYMTNLKTDETIKVEDQEIEKVEEYKYLGQTLRPKLKDCTNEEVLIRITSVWSCFGRHKLILCKKKKRKEIYLCHCEAGFLINRDIWWQERRT